MSPKPCVDCGGMYEPRGTRQQRCETCAVKRNRKKNLEYQHAFRVRHKTKEDAERSERRTWQMDAARSRFELLASDGMSATAIARKTGHSHHTVLEWLARPEAQWRVRLLRIEPPEMPC
jgi:DNA invertase Pin-like site-specific DNA recombinase